MTKPLALIVEDNKDIAHVFHKALTLAGFETEVILDGAEAQQRIPQISPVVVILDLHLPHVSGEDLLAQLRADERLVDTKVLIATADAALGHKLSEAADLVLLKPISFVQLSTLAARFLPSE